MSRPRIYTDEQRKQRSCEAQRRFRKDHSMTEKQKQEAREVARKHREDNKEKYKKYYQDNKESYRKNMRKWQEENKEKIAAHYEVRKALRKGTLVKEPCEVCGELKAEAHHEDYNFPLDVIWLCLSHHKELHRLEREAIAKKKIEDEKKER